MPIRPPFDFDPDAFGTIPIAKNTFDQWGKKLYQ
jgi:hypothetical protein